MENSSLHTDQPEGITLREQIDSYLRYWPWFALSVVVFLVCAAVYLRYATPVYQGKASIIIKDVQGTGAASELAAFEELGVLSGSMGGQSIENEIEVLKSKKLIRGVADGLDLHIRYYREGVFKSSEIFGNRPFTIKILERKKDVPFPEHPYYFQVESPEAIQITNPETGEEKGVGFGKKIRFPFAEITILPNLEFEGRKEKVAVTFSEPDDVVSQLQEAITVQPTDRNSTVIELTLNDALQDKSRAILNELIAEYNQDAIDDRSLVAQSTAEFIDERLQIIEGELAMVESDKVGFKQSHGLTDLQAEAGIYLENLSDFNKRQLETSTQLELVTSVIANLSAGEGISLLPANLGIGDAGLETLIGNYNQLVLERSQLLRSASEQHPAVVNITTQITDMKGNVLASLSNVRNSLEVRLRDLQSRQAQIGGRISQAAGTEREFRDIERQQNIKEALYLFLLQKAEETAISLAVKAPKAKIVDSAYTLKDPVSPKKKLIYLAAFIFGLLIPFGGIYAARMLYNKVRDRNEVERLARGIPVLGEVPRINPNDENLIQENDRSVLAESFRILRTNLQYLFANTTLQQAQGSVGAELKRSKKQPARTIFVTSTVKGEGKTFTAMNIALTLVNAGKKVLLAGADIRNPQLHRYIPEAKSKKGVSDYLVSQNGLELSSLIHPFGQNKKLHLLFSGAIPPNPAELWLNARTEALFSEMKQDYDYVIVDTAPAMLVTDTFLISKYADTTLYVVRADYTERRLLDFPVDATAEKKLKNPAIVLNNVRLSNFGYGNKYGYTYGAEKKGIVERVKDFVLNIIFRQ